MFQKESQKRPTDAACRPHSTADIDCVGATARAFHRSARSVVPDAHGALGDSALDERGNLVHLPAVDKRTELGSGISLVPDAHPRRHLLVELTPKLSGNTGLDVDRFGTMQDWPELRSLAIIAPSTTVSSSASSNMISGAFPPSSIEELLVSGKFRGSRAAEHAWAKRVRSSSGNAPRAQSCRSAAWCPG